MIIHIIEDERASASIRRYVAELKQHYVQAPVTIVPFGRAVGKRFSAIRKYVVLPLRLLAKRPRHVILPSERYAFLLPALIFSRTIVVCHDMHTLIDMQAKWYHKCLYRWNLILLSIAHRVVCVSHHTREDLLRVRPSLAPKSVVVYNGLESTWFDAVTSVEHRLQQLVHERYVLMVGSSAWYKNLERAAAVLSAGKFRCVKVGQGGALEQLPAETFTHFAAVSEDELRWLYQHAALLFAPSIHEGFGWPALEAMASGCPVVTAKNSSIPEVCGDAAYYIDPYNTDQMAKGIREVMSDHSLRQNLIDRGRAQASGFRWSIAVDQIHSLFLST